MNDQQQLLEQLKKQYDGAPVRINEDTSKPEVFINGQWTPVQLLTEG